MNLQDLLKDSLADHLGRDFTDREWKRFLKLMDRSSGYRTRDEVFDALDRGEPFEETE